MRRLLREPLLHFLGLGALLFLLYGWLHAGVWNASDEIFVSRDQLQSLQMQFERTWQRSPTPEELDRLVNSWVREEIYYREGLAARLDRDDPVVRRRIGQKFEFMTEAAPQAPPTTVELQAWLDAHADKYAIEPRYSLRQVYFDPARHGAKLDSDIAAARRTLEAGNSFAGDTTMLPATLEDAAASDVERQFGADFTASLKTLPVGVWQGPVRSGFGMHLVKLSASEHGRLAKLNEVRAAVERDLLEARAAAAIKAEYDKLRAKYKLRVESAGTEAAAAK